MGSCNCKKREKAWRSKNCSAETESITIWLLWKAKMNSTFWLIKMVVFYILYISVIYKLLTFYLKLSFSHLELPMLHVLSQTLHMNFLWDLCPLPGTVLADPRPQVMDHLWNEALSITLLEIPQTQFWGHFILSSHFRMIRPFPLGSWSTL